MGGFLDLGLNFVDARRQRNNRLAQGGIVADLFPIGGIGGQVLGRRAERAIEPAIVTNQIALAIGRQRIVIGGACEFKAAIAWAAEHRQELEDEWNRLNQR